jgi:hypothetical protein
MGILDLINKKRNEFATQRIEAQTIRLNRTVETRKKEAALMKLKEEDNKNKAYISGVKHAQRDKALAGLKGFAAGVRKRNQARSHNPVKLGSNNQRSAPNIFTQGSTGGVGFNSLYHGTSSNSRNPYNRLGEKPIKQKPIKKKAIIYE